MERKTPLSVPAYRVAGVLGLIARVETPRFVSPVFTAVHVSPLSVERKMPLLLVLAYRMVGVTGLMTREVKTFRETPFTSLSVRPAFTAVQWLPLSAERKIPPSLIPAYRVVGVRGSMAISETCFSVSPLFMAVQ